MMKIHIIMHESYEAPAEIEKWAEQKRHEMTFTRFYDGDKLPGSVGDFDFLIVMGGPQSADTKIAECPYFDAVAEKRFIAEAIQKDKLVLGVCLGAQLIGEALGAKYEHSPNKEVGVFEVSLTAEGREDKVFSRFPSKFLVGHWHGDMPGLTSESAILATSIGCPRQIVRYTPKVYGFQCHFEFNHAAIDAMIENCSHELERLKSLPYVQGAEELRSQDYNSMNLLLFEFLDYMESALDRLE